MNNEKGIWNDKQYDYENLFQIDLSLEKGDQYPEFVSLFPQLFFILNLFILLSSNSIPVITMVCPK